VIHHDGGPILSHGFSQMIVDPAELHKGLVRFLHEYTQTYMEDLWNVLQSAPYGDGPASLPLVSAQRSLSLALTTKHDVVFLWHRICFTCVSCPFLNLDAGPSWLLFELSYVAT
jgi:hypothetical protein